MTTGLKALFWLCSMLTGYVYLLYPVLVTGISRFFGKEHVKNGILPHVSIIIAAYNEERDIARKIENTLALDYPSELMEIIVGSDGSTDRTADIVRAYEGRGVRLMDFHMNRGKTMVQNDCVHEASHEIVVFMDAASMCEKESLKKLVSSFADSSVGVVAGRVVFTRRMPNLTTESQGVYWRYEQMLKKAESSLGSLVGADGPLYAIRKGLYTMLDEDIISDFISPLLVIRNGYRAVYEPDAVTYEEATTRAADELRTRRRIVARGLTGLSRYPGLINPFAVPMLAWQILSHKILRWLGGFYFLGMLFSSLLLASGRFFMIAAGALTAVLLLSCRGFMTRDDPRKWFAVPYYFILVNLAAALGLIEYAKGRKVISWTPVRG